MNLTNTSDRIEACALYVIGQLSSDDQHAFEVALSKDPALAAEVARWRDSLLPLADQVPSLEPSTELWSRIAAALPPEAARNAQSLARDKNTRASLWSSLALWRTVSAVAVAVSLFMGVLLSTQEPELRVYVAVLKSPELQNTGWLVRARSNGSVRLVPLNIKQVIPAGKTLQLWTQVNGAKNPVPIGLIAPGKSFEIPAHDLPGLNENQLFAISLEPAGGSPTGLPTGPILFAGNTEKI